MRFYKTIILMSLMVFVSSCKKEINADILIQNGSLYNGVDTIPNKHSIAIKGDKIIFMGDSKKVFIKASKIIDASGLIVSPGFIDPHTHADRDLNNPKNIS